MSDDPDIGRELTDIRERLDRLHAAAPTPALAAMLRNLSELALVAEGYARPETARLVPAEYRALEEGAAPSP